MNGISLIIPTYNRIEFLDKILRFILLDNYENLNEIIVVDSYSIDGTKQLIENYQSESNTSIRYKNVSNSISIKRNEGIKLAKSDFLIFIDDDCVPTKNFFKYHYEACLNNINQINCGNVYFADQFIKNSNVIKYRNSRHIPFLDIGNGSKNLSFQNIVTMNMSLRKKDILSKNLYFNEGFMGYGMEDNYFGLEAIKLGFQIKTNQASIIHYDFKGISLHAIKLYNTALGGVGHLSKLNQNAVWDLRYSFYLEKDFPHNNFLKKYYTTIIRLLLSFKLSKILIKFLIATDHLSFFYSNVLFKYVGASYYLKGISDRKNINFFKDPPKDWYVEKPK